MQCAGNKKNGDRCKRKVKSVTHCWQHKSQLTEPGKKTLPRTGKETQTLKRQTSKQEKPRRKEKPGAFTKLLKTLNTRQINALAAEHKINSTLARDLKQKVLKQFARHLYVDPRLTQTTEKKYLIKKGQVFWHGSPNDIKIFDRRAYFGFNKYTSLAIMLLSLLRLKWTDDCPEDFHLYKLVAKHDFEVDEHDILLLVVMKSPTFHMSGYEIDTHAPPISGKTMKDYCATENGWVSCRESTPLPIRYKYLSKNQDLWLTNKTNLESTDRKTRLKCMKAIIREANTHYNKHDPKEFSKDYEFVFCKPHKLLTVERHWKVSGPKFMSYAASTLAEVYDKMFDVTENASSLSKMWKRKLDKFKP